MNKIIILLMAITAWLSGFSMAKSNIIEELFRNSSRTGEK